MRIPQELKNALDAASIENKRSLTAEVVSRLEESLAHSKSKQEVKHNELDQMREAHLSVVLAGLTLAQMAAKFVQIEVPAVGETASFPRLLETLEAGGKIASLDKASSPNEGHQVATEVLASYKAVADELGITRMAEALRRSSSGASDASTEN